MTFVLRVPGNDIWAIESKHITAPKLSRGLHVVVNDINANRTIMVYAGEREVPARDALGAISWRPPWTSYVICRAEHAS